MRKVVLSNMTTANGFFEGPTPGDIYWHHVDDEFFKEANSLLDSVDTLLFGRKTYQGMAEYWTSEAAKTDDPVITAKMNNYDKIVFSTTLDKAGWNKTRLIKTKVAEEMTKLKNQPGKDMVIFGSSDLASSFLEMGLLDEIRMFVNPIILGDGKPMFKGVREKIELKLLNTRTFGNGNVMIVYEPIRKGKR